LLLEHLFAIIVRMSRDLVADLEQLPDVALDGRIRALELERRRLDAELAAAVAVAERRQVPAIDGHRSLAAYLRATLNCSSAEAARLRRLARAVDSVAGLAAAWHTGRFGASQASRLADVAANPRVGDRLAEFAPILLEHAERLPFRDFALCVDRFVTLADADGAHDARDDAVEHRSAHVRALGSSLDVTASGGDGLTASEMIAIHRRFTEAEHRADVDARRAAFGDQADQHPLPRTSGQRRFDALVAIFRHAASATGLTDAAEPLVNVVVDAATWARVLTEAGLAPTTTLSGEPVDPFTGLARPSDLLTELVSWPELATARCETADGVALHPHDVLRAALAGHVRRVVVDAAGVVTDMGRRRRLFVGPARDAARLLLVRCEHPGCELPADLCDVDHALEWAAGGTTDQANSRVRCSSHNVDKTRRRWRSRRATDGRTYTIRTDGTIMLPVGVRPPVFPDEDDHDVETPDELERTVAAIRRRAAALTAA
jgi:hypothetical protein